MSWEVYFLNIYDMTAMFKLCRWKRKSRNRRRHDTWRRRLWRRVALSSTLFPGEWYLWLPHKMALQVQKGTLFNSTPPRSKFICNYNFANIFNNTYLSCFFRMLYLLQLSRSIRTSGLALGSLRTKKWLNKFSQDFKYSNYTLKKWYRTICILKISCNEYIADPIYILT